MNIKSIFWPLIYSEDHVILQLTPATAIYNPEHLICFLVSAIQYQFLFALTINQINKTSSIFPKFSSLLNPSKVF
jgi:hypothetical protein